MCSHIILLAMVSFVYITSTERTMLGNAWHTVAQMMSNDTIKDIIVESKKKTDKEVENLFKNIGKGKVRYRLAWKEDGDGVVLIAVGD